MLTWIRALYIKHCWLAGWTDYGMRLNANIEGLLNWIDDNFIAQCTGYGIYTTTTASTTPGSSWSAGEGGGYPRSEVVSVS